MHNGNTSFSIRMGPSNAFDDYVLMYTELALTAWALRRLNAPGFLLRNIIGTKNLRLSHHELWLTK